MNEHPKYNRIFTIVIDSLGIGAAADAAAYGDAGTDTLGHIAQRTAHFETTQSAKAWNRKLTFSAWRGPAPNPTGYYARLHEASTGKDTMTGHWEMMGLHITKPFQTFY